MQPPGISLTCDIAQFQTYALGEQAFLSPVMEQTGQVLVKAKSLDTATGSSR